MRKLLILSLALAYAFLCMAKVATISGVESSYAGKQLKLESKLDEIVGLTQTLDSCLVDSTGRFHFKVDIDRAQQVFIPMETANSFLFIEPDKNYEVRIPSYSERTLAQKLDPFFKPADILTEIVGLKPADLNYKLMEFEDAFDFYSMKHLVYGSRVDSILVSIEQMKEIFNDLYEDDYEAKFMEYRFLLLLNSTPQVYQDSIIVRLNDLGVEEESPAFWDIFNNLFENFISQLVGKREEYVIFQRIIEEGNVKMYFAVLKNRYKITDKDLRELVAIKLLYDLLNQEQFDQFKVTEMLQEIGSGIANPRNRDLLTYILNSASALYIGSPAPDFTIYDTAGKTYKLSDFFGKFIYLNFENSMINQTQKDLEVLLRFQNDFKKDIEIINVGLYDTPERVSKLAQRYNGKMRFFYTENPDSIKKMYAIESIPSFFMIDKDGNFLMTKGAEPTDELRMLLQKIFKSY